MVNPTVLPCGCIVGKQLCPEAQRLRNAEGAAFMACVGESDPALHEAYEKAAQAYRDHFRRGTNDGR